MGATEDYAYLRDKLDRLDERLDKLEQQILTKDDIAEMIQNMARDRVLNWVKIVIFNILTIGGTVLAAKVNGWLHFGEGG